MKKENFPREPLFTRRSGLLSLSVAVLVSAFGFILDRTLVREGMPRLDMLLLSNTVTGLFAGIWVFQMAHAEKASRAVVQERMKTIAELNHHIRNALQVIKFFGGQQRPELDGVQLQLINDSVNRIEWALREVLPKYPANAFLEPKKAASRSIGPAA